MIPKDNYRTQAEQAKKRFLTYDQSSLVKKFRLAYDDDYLYVRFLCKPYRINRQTGDMEFRDGECWHDGNSYGEVMTLLDLLCDSRDDRWISGSWQSMQTFGMQFHRNLLEDPADALAEAINREPELLHRACRTMGGQKIPGGDYGWAVELFDGLKIGMLFWHGDEEFAPRIRWLWDANAKMYLRYETMHFAIGLLRRRLMEQM